MVGHLDGCLGENSSFRSITVDHGTQTKSPLCQTDPVPLSTMISYSDKVLPKDLACRKDALVDVTDLHCNRNSVKLIHELPNVAFEDQACPQF